MQQWDVMIPINFKISVSSHRKVIFQSFCCCWIYHIVCNNFTFSFKQKNKTTGLCLYIVSINFICLEVMDQCEIYSGFMLSSGPRGIPRADRLVLGGSGGLGVFWVCFVPPPPRLPCCLAESGCWQREGEQGGMRRSLPLTQRDIDWIISVCQYCGLHRPPAASGTAPTAAWENKNLL